jgi:hypothetical protein
MKTLLYSVPVCLLFLANIGKLALLFLIIIIIRIAVASQTPVIGGLCNLDASDVEIGGKQTQFYLKCEQKKGYVSFF